MLWIDIPLPDAGTCPETDRLLAEARTLIESLPAVQERHGLDTPAVTRCMEQVGGLLFRAVTAHDPEAFHPDRERAGAVSTDPESPADDQTIAYHVVADRDLAGLPWHWLHNGVAFLIETSGIEAASHGSRVPRDDPPRLWMHRHRNLRVSSGERADDQRVRPEVLFVPGHGRDEIRRLIFREAEGIDRALAASSPALARLRIPGAVTPGLLASRAMLYQALHFAAPTSQPPEVSQAGENRWLAGLIAAAGQPDADPDTLDDLVGLDLEVVGVDPIEAALDQAVATYARRGVPAAVGPGVPAVEVAWWLDDGPVRPERLGRDGCLPPLVFSNSWCSLGWLGRRFLAAGASTFIGTAIPLYSRPARHFAALFYGALGAGLCACAAHREASLALRERLGPEHPSWLAYGIQGYGCLRLADL
ncbi:MAG TPA: hypothetical protein PLL30_04365 [Candidatus Krumholzibacteria bacterium]|nr:hypothetical protein [Candidatus Krumholzibacteria bacterium]HPD71008.1 hypothetical protein [Candidatus Krumholzibacteria bacterium]HRY39292.1 hypothetical protein [Candidatus Krumholzibacteria bacterium]